MRKLQAGLDSNRWDRRAQRPTVAWPSEAVRVGDVSITFFQKRVEAPFYGRETRPVLQVKRNRTETFHNVMVRDCTWVHRPVFPAVAWPSEAVRERDVAISLTRSASRLEPTPSTWLDEQNSGGGSPGRGPEDPGRTCPDKPSAEAARSGANPRRVSRVTGPR